MDASPSYTALNAGETMHQGVEVGLGVSLPAGLAVEAAWSEARHTCEPWSPRRGPYWMDQQNENRYEGHRLWGARAHVHLAERVRVFGRVTNLTNTRYAERATFNTFRGQEFAPGLPQTVYVGLELK